ncbi:MAG: NgoPII family restriction endonuclease [Sediminibacterium sp.]|nr:MAG: NgoPII family restriction endonuclease [Sediminibacterium sp.] [Sediminibacterium sp. FEMGT703S]
MLLKNKIVMYNTLNSIIYLIETQNFKLSKGKLGTNRIQNVGNALETFVKDLYARSFSSTKKQKEKNYAKTFSFMDSSNSPPDVIIRGGDALEVKKMEGLFSDVQLNSSYPKYKLRIDNPLISNECKNCEQWTEKDIVYAIGFNVKKSLRLLWLVYGDCYASDIEIYDNLKITISEGIRNIPDIKFEETNELGKVKALDPLEITNLRIRGMWTIQNPNRLFSDFINYDASTKFQIICLMRNTKYLSFDKESIKSFEGVIDPNLFVTDVSVRDPNNPQSTIDCKLITYKIF